MNEGGRRPGRGGVRKRNNERRGEGGTWREGLNSFIIVMKVDEEKENKKKKKFEEIPRRTKTKNFYYFQTLFVRFQFIETHKKKIKFLTGNPTMRFFPPNF